MKGWVMPIVVGVSLIGMMAIVDAQQGQPRIEFIDAAVLSGAGRLVYMDIAYVSDEVDADGAKKGMAAALNGRLVDPYVLTGFRRSQDPVIVPWSAPPAEVVDVVSLRGGLEGWNGLGQRQMLLGPQGAAVASLCRGMGRDGTNGLEWFDLQPSGVAGVACWDGIDECDIQMDVLYTQGVPLRGILLHEAGHCWGLGHSLSPLASMYFSYRGFQVPQPDDIAGWCAIYGCIGSTPTATSTATPTRTNTATPTRTPTPTPTLVRIVIPGVARDGP